MFAYVQLEERIPRNYPLQQIKQLVDHVLSELDSAFERFYSIMRRPGIPRSND